MGIVLAVVIGVISGILTSAFLYLLTRFFLGVFVPWYQRIIYKGVDLHGVWSGEVADSSELLFPFSLVLKQNAHDLKGTGTLDKSPTLDGDQVTTYAVKGNVWEGYVTLNFETVDRTRLSYATALLQVLKGGRRLKGYFVFRDMRHDEIRERTVTFDRED